MGPSLPLLVGVVGQGWGITGLPKALIIVSAGDKHVEDNHSKELWGTLVSRGGLKQPGPGWLVFMVRIICALAESLGPGL